MSKENLFKIAPIILAFIATIMTFYLKIMYLLGFFEVFLKSLIVSFIFISIVFSYLMLSTEKRKWIFKQLFNSLLFVIFYHILFISILAVILSFSVLEINSSFGNQKISIVKGIVKDKKVDKGSKYGVEYNFYLQTKTDKKLINIDKETYNSLKNEDKVRMKIKTGCLGIEYILRHENEVLKVDNNKVLEVEESDSDEGPSE